MRSPSFPRLCIELELTAIVCGDARRYGTLYEGYSAKWVYFEVVVIVRKAAAAMTIGIFLDPVAQASAVVVPSTLYCLAVWRLRPFAVIKGARICGHTFDVLNDTELFANLVVALNQWIFLLNGADAIPSSNAWGVPLGVLNVLFLLVLFWRTVALSRNSKLGAAVSAAGKSAAEQQPKE